MNHDSLIAEGRTRDKPCSVIMDTGASVTIAKFVVVAGQPERKRSGP